MGFSMNVFFHFFLINKEKTIYNLCLEDSIKKKKQYTYRTVYWLEHAFDNLLDDPIVNGAQETLGRVI